MTELELVDRFAATAAEAFGQRWAKLPRRERQKWRTAVQAAIAEMLRTVGAVVDRREVLGALSENYTYTHRGTLRCKEK